MKRYLAVMGRPPERVELARSPIEAAARGYLASPMYPAAGGAFEAIIPSRARIRFYAPRSPRAFLYASLIAQRPDSQTVFVTHGLASVVILAHAEDPIWDAAEAWETTPHETWEIEEGGVTSIAVALPEDPPPADIGELDVSGIPQGLAAQLRQAHTNLAALQLLIRRYAPEMSTLVTSLQAGVASTAKRAQEIADAPPDLELEVAAAFHMERMVELNHSLGALRNQTFSGVFPLGTTSFDIAEYSLLGVGTAIRGVWRHSFHLASVTGAANLPGRLRAGHRTGGPFDFFKNRARLNYGKWASSSSAGSHLPTAAPESVRLHVPYFSGKGGFRETTHAITAPWQAVHASAASKWTLLTICHEFLHAHFRDIFAALFAEEDLRDEVFERMAYAYSQDAQTPQECIWGLYVSALLAWDRVHNRNGGSDRRTEVPARVSAEDVRNLHREHHRWFSEIVVHTLDFHYTYRADDLDYIESLWRSWSEVPRVATNLDHYLLRTLAGLSSSSDPEWSGPEAFVDSCERMIVGLNAMEGPRIPHLDYMITVLEQGANEDESALELQREFLVARYAVQFAKQFLYSEDLHSSLISDSSTVAAVTDEDLDQASDYPFGPYEYPAVPVESPLRFLLTHLRSVDDSETRFELEQRSLWQFLVLVEGEVTS